jgi:beta-glucosidase
VLLKNDDNLLPLRKNGTIAVIGPLADSRRNMLGTWSVSGDWNKAVTVIEGIREVAGDDSNVLYARGSNISDDTTFAKRVNVFGQEIVMDERSPDAMIEEAVQIANQADVIVAVVGEAADMSGEAASMVHISLQPAQRKLLEALKQTGKPIAMVLFNGRPMVLNWETENMTAILDVWFGGTEGGRAIADVLFGDVVPGGKLTTSFPVHVGQVPIYHSILNTGRPDGGTKAKFRSNYLDIPNEPLYPFGYGLSYTTFDYSEFSLSATEMNESGSVTASVTVTNTGDMPGSEVVQMYIQDVMGSISRPLKELKGFEKITLAPGESKTVTFNIDSELLSFYNADLEFGAEPGEFKVYVGTNSRDVLELSFELK